jgi:hypothetical protein
MSFSLGVFKKGSVLFSKLFHPNEKDIDLKKATRKQDVQGIKDEKKGDEASKCQRNYFL